MDRLSYEIPSCKKKFIFSRSSSFSLTASTPHSVHYENILSFLLLLTPSFFLLYVSFYTFYVFYAIDKIFNLRMAFSIQGSVYLCKNETIEICCMATRYSKTSSIKTEYTIFFCCSFFSYLFPEHAEAICTAWHKNLAKKKYVYMKTEFYSWSISFLSLLNYCRKKKSYILNWKDDNNNTTVGSSQHNLIINT